MNAGAFQGTSRPDAVTADRAGGITRLALQNFRNYDSLVLDVAARHIVLTGANGIGKTNILEAISLMAPGRGLRQAKPAEWIKQAAHPETMMPLLEWGISLTLEDGPRLATRAPAQKPLSARRLVQHEGVTLSSQAQLAEYLAIVWLTPQMDGLFLGEASQRRKFMDRLVYAVSPEHAVRLYRYEHAVKQRNRLLKDRAPAALIRSLHPVLVAEGVAIAAARLENTDQLNHALQDMHHDFPTPFIQWSGQVEQWLMQHDALTVETLYHERLEKTLDEDLVIGQTRLGVHRSDAMTRHVQKNIDAAQCSTGEQKALLLSLVLAHARWLKSIAPDRPLILLLDDVAAHLDPDRRAQVFQWIDAMPVQAWFSGTEETMFNGLGDDAQYIALPL